MPHRVGAARNGASIGSGTAWSAAVDERDRLVERRPARTDVMHRVVLVPDRHATEEDELRRG